MLYAQTHDHYSSSKATLIVTHCEEIDEHDNEDSIEKLFNHSELVQSHLNRTFFEKGIFFMGCIQSGCQEK